MAKVLGLDLGTNSVGWAIVDTSANKVLECGVKIFPEAVARHPHQRRRLLRGLRRRNYRFAYGFAVPTGSGVYRLSFSADSVTISKYFLLLK